MSIKIAYLNFENGSCQLFNLKANSNKYSVPGPFTYAKLPCTTRWVCTDNYKFFQKQNISYWIEFNNGIFSFDFTQIEVQDGGETVILDKINDGSIITLKKNEFLVNGKHYRTGKWECKKNIFYNFIEIKIYF